MINCNDCRWDVSQQLWSMLQHLLEDRPPPTDNKIWIDALCINQDDREEKARQIPCMRRIYGRAGRVLIWLGEHENDSEAVMQEMPGLSGKIEKLGRMTGRQLPSWAISTSLEKEGLKPIDHPLWQAISHFIRRPWSQRLWVVQEAVLSRELVVMCGNMWVTWDIFIAFCRALQITEIFSVGTEEMQAVQIANDALYFFGWIDGLRDDIARSERKFLPTTLEAGRMLKCSVKHDHVFGLLGLIPPEEEQQMVASGLVDYTKPYWRTYTDVVKWYLPFDAELALLSLAASAGKHPQIPSWCPDWDDDQEMHPFRLCKSYQAGCKEIGNAKRSICAVEGIDHIQVLGFRIDEVLQVVDCASDKWKLQGFLGSEGGVYDWEVECLHLSQRVYGYGLDDLPEAHWRTLVGNEINHSPCGEDAAAKYWDWKIFSKGKERPLAKGGMEYLEALTWANNGRSFFSTRDGRTGMGPKGIRPHDSVCVLYGAGPVFVLRFDRYNDTARLIGDAYIHGLMAGEALEMDGKNGDENFVLR